MRVQESTTTTELHTQKDLFRVSVCTRRDFECSCSEFKFFGKNLLSESSKLKKSVQKKGIIFYVPSGNDEVARVCVLDDNCASSSHDAVSIATPFAVRVDCPPGASAL